MRNDKENLIVKLTFKFALKIIEYTEKLRSLNKFEMATQLFKSGTSIGANIREAQNAESKADFIHKFKISAKEADETEYWLELCKVSKHYPNPENELFEELEAIIKIISKILSSSKKTKFSNHQITKFSN
ncbi:four helix bundle protein [Mesohalobacter halotolerans]|jgi:four helix bundle protein|uniref:Four helix bundle protein n=1 Tax=Mesohalobacter halotolerans TaxID=1883405 RepID=A0A4U5TSH5_9FLAO|nr:four helix bundle protein [Mesohalobacter halotolerans]MBS3738893.1 four helix bundle protein [Psychroflexus sp.]NBC58501.1 four helix bundle protein [Bacteroidota bacterium]TKS56972.1 four helix bundle protein [Mesohalobacter halotolerans]